MTSAITRPEQFPGDDYRRTSPRFQGENFTNNMALVAKVTEIAIRKSCTPGQLALAWVLPQGDDIVPIPGTKRRNYLEENINALDVQLSTEELAEIDAIFPIGAAAESRYVEAGMKMLSG